MIVDILTPDSVLFSGEAISVKVPGTKGQFEILDNHAALISSLETAGTIRVITSENKVLNFEAKGGAIEVLASKVIILTES